MLKCLIGDSVQGAVVVEAKVASVNDMVGTSLFC